MSQKSQFVTVLAWIIIALSGFALLISILQNILLNTVFPIEEMEQSMQAGETPDGFPNFIFQHIRIVFAAIAGVLALHLIGGIGLLKRKNWARILMSALFVVGILYLVSAVVIQFVFIDSVGAGIPDKEFRIFANVIRIGSLIIALAFVGLNSWLIYKLNSRQIVAEFVPQGPLP